MRFLSLLLCSGLLLTCKSLPGTSRWCIERTLQQDKTLARQMEADRKKTSESDAILKMTQGMRAITLTACPEDFRLAYTKHIHAWDEFRENSTGLAAFLKALLVGILTGLTRNPVLLVEYLRTSEEYGKAINSTLNLESRRAQCSPSRGKAA